MKKPIIISSLIITLIASNFIIKNSNTEVTANNEQPTIQESYVITEVSNNEYYGKSTIDDSGIYFTSDYINSGTIVEGDTIQAYFENEYADSLTHVDKLN